MKYIFFLFFSSMLPLAIYAYDFEAETYLRKILYYNITSAEDADVKTCEVTYRDAENIEGDIIYNKNNEHYNGVISIPSYVSYQGVRYRVTGIGAHAFQNTNVTFCSAGETLYVGYEGVNGPQKPNITYCGAGDNFYIGYEAFKNCLLLLEYGQSCINLDISDCAFENCISLGTLFLANAYKPCGTIKISSRAFHGCSELTFLDIERAVPENFDIANDAFDWQHNEVINCILRVSTDNIGYFENVEPWCRFSGILEYDKELPTTIGAVNASTRSAFCRNAFGLNGNRIDSLSYKGIYILNGKKIMRK